MSWKVKYFPVGALANWLKQKPDITECLPEGTVWYWEPHSIKQTLEWQEWDWLPDLWKPYLVMREVGTPTWERCWRKQRIQFDYIWVPKETTPPDLQDIDCKVGACMIAEDCVIQFKLGSCIVKKIEYSDVWDIYECAENRYWMQIDYFIYYL